MKKLQETKNNYRNCPLCSSKRTTPLNKTMVSCNYCSLVYNYRKPLFSENHWVDFTFNPRIHSYDLQRIKFFKYYWKYISKIIKKQSGTILDVGCGPGIILKIASECNWLAEGVEISDKIVDFAQKYSNCKIYMGNIENLNYINKYDLILMTDTFRHLKHPLLSMKICYQSLNPDGHIVIRDLNANNFLNKKRVTLSNPYDLQFLSKKTSLAFFKKVGFKKFYFYPSPMSFLTTPIIKNFSPTLQNYIMKIINNFLKLLYFLSLKKIIITPEVLFIAKK